jgi:hypothetical protein
MSTDYEASGPVLLTYQLILAEVCAWNIPKILRLQETGNGMFFGLDCILKKTSKPWNEDSTILRSVGVCRTTQRLVPE